LHRAGAPTTSPGRVPISVPLPIRSRFPIPCRPKARLPAAAQRMARRRTWTKPRPQSRVRSRVILRLRLRPMSRPSDRIAVSTKLMARHHGRLCRSAPQLRIGDSSAGRAVPAASTVRTTNLACKRQRACTSSGELRAATSLARLWRDQSKVQQARELLAASF
jgi:hypothetical protein